MKRIFSVFLVLICLVGFVNPVLAEPEDKVNINVLPNEPGSVSTLKDSDILVESPEIESQSGILMDIESGEFLFSKDPNKKVYPASTTKVLTALIALENGEVDYVFDIAKTGIQQVKDSSNLEYYSANAASQAGIITLSIMILASSSGLS